MKIFRRLIKLIRGRFTRKDHSDEEIFCTETSCRVPKVIKGNIDQYIPSHDHCFNISNCSL